MHRLRRVLRAASSPLPPSRGCDAARLLAPGLIAEDARGLSYFTREPATEEERAQAWRAMLACPSATIGGPKPPLDVFPWELTPGVWMLEYNARHSFGATSWLLARPDGNAMVDAPRWSSALAERIAAMGGISRISHLPHAPGRRRRRRQVRRALRRAHPHPRGRPRAAPDAEAFRGETALAPGLRMIPTLGHTRGSAMLLADARYLFTGDSLEWNRETQDLSAFADFTWYSWAEQRRSLARLADAARFEWALPGHGGWGRADDMHDRLRALVQGM